MRIGELSRRTQIPIRMLRYYEERGLLAPERAPSGYRLYGEEDVDRAVLVSSLIRSGLPTKLIIPMLAGEADDSLADQFRTEMDRLNARIKCMTISRNAVERHLRTVTTSAAGA